MRKFDSLTELNANSITNLSSIVKDFVIQSLDRFQQVTRDILWLNTTLQGQSELHTTIRQLEFALLQLTQRFDELTNAVQYMSLGKLPISFINPTTLYNILRDVTLQLPENFELVAGTRIKNINLYCKLVTEAVIGNTHRIKLFMNVLLKTADSYFEVFKIIALLTKLSNDKFIRYQVDFPYFALNYNQHDYALLMETQSLLHRKPDDSMSSKYHHLQHANYIL